MRIGPRARIVHGHYLPVCLKEIAKFTGVNNKFYRFEHLPRHELLLPIAGSELSLKSTFDIPATINSAQLN